MNVEIIGIFSHALDFPRLFLLCYFPLLYCPQTSKPKFVNFYKENRANFERDNPHLTPAELTKFAVNKFKQLYPDKSNGIEIDESNKAQNGNSNAKRKINIDDHTERSGIAAKLARFSCEKK